MRSLNRAACALLLLCGAAHADPATKEGDYTVHDFKFRSGEAMADEALIAARASATSDGAAGMVGRWAAAHARTAVKARKARTKSARKSAAPKARSTTGAATGRARRLK